MDKDNRVTVEEFKRMLDNETDNDSMFIRVYDLFDGYKDIRYIRIHGNTILIHTK